MLVASHAMPHSCWKAQAVSGALGEKNSPIQGKINWPGTQQQLSDGNSILSIKTTIDSEAKPFYCWLVMRDLA